MPPSFVDTDLSLTLSSFFSQFDRIWWIFFGWVLFLLYLSIEKWYYIFVWKLRKCEKMWETSRKCVFYIIFRNTTKHLKIFSKAFFGMQPNTWKYFPFLKIFSFENILHSENIVHPTKRSLNLTRKAIIISATKLLWKTKEWDVLISWIKRWHKSSYKFRVDEVKKHNKNIVW